MRGVSDKSKIIFLMLLIFFLLGIGAFWMDYIGIINMSRYLGMFRGEPGLSMNASDDEPSLIEKEEFEKEKEKLLERIEELDKREALLAEREKTVDGDREKLEQVKSGLQIEQKKLENERNRDAGYRKNVMVLANKLANMPPEKSVAIMVNWDEPLIIDVLRQMDADSEAEGKMSITAYLLTLFPNKEQASRIMYLMTQI